MKKLIIAIALFAASITAGAQEFASTPRIGNDSFFFSVMDHIGFGFVMPEPVNADGERFIPVTAFGKNREFFLNIAAVEFSPYATGHLLLGADINWSTFRLDKGHYWNPGTGSVSISSAEGIYSKVKKSNLRVTSFVFPLDFTQSFGPIQLTVGASAELNLPAKTKFKGVDMSDTAVKFTEKGIETESFTYNDHAMLSYYGWGLYVKYRPVPQFKDGSAPLFTSWNAGIYLR